MYKKFDSLSRFVIGVSAVLFTGTVALGDMAPNPRSALQVGRDNRDVQSVSEKNTSRSTVRHIASVNGRGEKTSVDRRATGARTVARTVMAPQKASVGGGRDSATVSRAATPLSRSAVRSAVVSTGNISNGRSGTTKKIRKAPLVRASVARATALFDDVSKIGGGYSQCRDSYATCMDQFCGKANETYRRCFCSSRFTDFRRTEEALDQAKVLLQSFEDNNLNAVDKTAAEVGAMYTATVGEAAIKNDTSGAQSILNEIGDLLSGKIKTSTSGVASSTSMGVLSLDFSTDLGDIWGGGGDAFGGGASSIFSSGGGQNLSNLEGEALYKAVDQQCRAMVGNSCESEAAFNMSKSSYGILITQDCNAYEKSLNAKREQVKSTVRQAEKILRQARLEDYRAHNSQDVNECLDKVRTAMTQPMACGGKWERCLDYTGVYINQQTGEPIYSPRLFQLVEVINLDGAPSGNDAYTDVLTNNTQFDAFLESKKMFARQALDTCRDLSDVVWNEFKRSALIEIAQAQDEKIEEVKMSCVSTMTQCYDTQTGALQDFDTTTAQVSGAMSVYAAKEMCKDKVSACAALYGKGVVCNFDPRTGALTNPEACGATALLAFVNTVDNVRVAEGCAAAIDSYLTELCTPTGDTAQTHRYPWNCRKYNLGKFEAGSLDAVTIKGSADTIEESAGNDLSQMVAKYAIQYCGDPTKMNSEKTVYTYAQLPVQTRTQVERKLNEINDELDYQLTELCESLDGYWLDPSSTDFKAPSNKNLPAFYKMVYGGNEEYTGFGRCIENTTRVRCLAYNTDNAKEGEDGEVVPQLASYDLAKDECTFSEDWFKTQCALLGNGYFENGVCYVAPVDNN